MTRRRKSLCIFNWTLAYLLIQVIRSYIYVASSFLDYKQLILFMWKSDSEPLGSWFRCFKSLEVSNIGDSCGSSVPQYSRPSSNAITTTGLNALCLGPWVQAVLASQIAQRCLYFSDDTRFFHVHSPELRGEESPGERV